MIHSSLRDFLKTLRDGHELITVAAEVDPHLELAEIHRRVIARSGPALLFEKVKGSCFPVVTNLFGTERRLELALGRQPGQLVSQLVHFAESMPPLEWGALWAHRNLLGAALKLGTRHVRQGPVTAVREQPPDLNTLPLLTCWPKDGGAFVTLPLVYTQHPLDQRHNLGMYRLQRHSATTTGMHWQIHKGGGFHYAAAEAQNRPLPASVFLGGPPALILAAIAPLPENLGELMVTSWLLGRRLPMIHAQGHPHPFPAEAEFVLQGSVEPRLRQPEGPFGDHYGYYSLQHEYPVFQVERLYRRKDAIYPATVVGKPCQEDYYIGDYLQELFSPLFPLLMPGIRRLWTFAQTGFHSLAAAVVADRYPREAMVSIFRLLGEGQLSLTKVLLATNQLVDLKDFPRLLVHILERVRWETDLMIFAKLSMDTLDYCGPEINKGSKAVILGLGDPVRQLPETFQGALPAGISQVRPFCPGCLVLAGDGYSEDASLAQQICRWPDFASWPLLIWTDDLAMTRSSTGFLWSVFTRFDPSSDIYAAETRLQKHQLSYRGPILIDTRMKPSYPAELTSDPQVARRVDARWTELFPGNVLKEQ